MIQDWMKDLPAFPRPASSSPDYHVEEQDGMRLRDYFAIRFASVMLGAPRQRNERRLNSGAIMHRAYELADAMLEARAK